MIKRSFDLDLLLRVTDLPHIHSNQDDFKIWFDNTNNLMFADGENVGLATLEYPGVYTVHWYFKVRGRDAIELAKRMLKNLFENYGAETIRGIVRVDLKASRWGARQVGCKSVGIFKFADGEDNEVFIVTKDDFLKGYKEWVM